MTTLIIIFGICAVVCLVLAYVAYRMERDALQARVSFWERMANNSRLDWAAEYELHRKTKSELYAVEYELAKYKRPRAKNGRFI